MNPSTSISQPRPTSPWSWHYQQLHALRDQLIEGCTGQNQEALRPLLSPCLDPADRGTDEFDHNLALGVLAHEQDFIYEIEAALQRIQAGTYGICEETGQTIPDARLRAVPWTRYTKDVEERLERLGQISSQPHLHGVASLQGPAPGGLANTSEPEQEELLTRELARHQREDDLKAIETGRETEIPVSEPNTEP